MIDYDNFEREGLFETGLKHVGTQTLSMDQKMMAIYDNKMPEVADDVGNLCLLIIARLIAK